MALEKFNWQNGSQVEPAKVEIDGVSHDVVDAQYEGETPLSASNLNLMQDTLLSNVVDDLEDESKIASCKAVKDIYSTDETKTNKVWLGKPVYRKLLQFTTGSSAGDKDIAHNITNLDTVINATGFSHKVTSTVNEFRIFPNIYRAVASNHILGIYYINQTIVQITYGSERTNLSGYIVLEYTKTTD